jgi:glutaryl-CoA dehydrogenase (non-decarboxylating)
VLDHALSEWIAHHIASYADQFDLDQAIPSGLVAQLAQAGILGSQIPVAYGGAPLDALHFGQLCENLGAASASVLSLLTVHSMVCTALVKWGTAAQKDRWLPRLARGDTLAAFALSEPDVGSDAQHVKTTFQREENHYLINGTKKWISFGQLAGVFLVMGHCAGKVIALLVDRQTPGLQVEPIRNMLGFRGAMLGQITLRDCLVPADSLVGSIDFGYAQIVGSVLDHGRYCIAWGATGLAQACLDASLRYAQQRETFGQALHKHQLIQHMLADMIANVSAARLLCMDAAKRRAESDPSTIMATATAKYFAARAVEVIASDAVQIHGANGCSSDYPVQRYLRDAKIMSLIEGSTQMQQMLIAQHGLMSVGARREH